MIRDYTESKARYEHSPVTLLQVEAIGREVLTKLKADKVVCKLRPKKPEDFKDVYSVTWKQFCKTWRLFPDAIRKFEIVFASEPITSFANSVCLCLLVNNQGVYGDPTTKDIVLSGYNVRKYDFKVFCEICEKIIGLKPAPAQGYDMPHERLMERVASSISNAELKFVISGPLAHKDYDGAIRSATVLVEDQLRKKCVANGGAAALVQTGTELAGTAYHPNNGYLLPPWPIAASALDGAHLLFRGFFMYLRNAWGHNTTVIGNDNSSVFDCLAMCQFLLLVISQSTKREEPP